jgi:hypothetical protein
VENEEAETVLLFRVWRIFDDAEEKLSKRKMSKLIKRRASKKQLSPTRKTFMGKNTNNTNNPDNPNFARMNGGNSEAPSSGGGNKGANSRTGAKYLGEVQLTIKDLSNDTKHNLLAKGKSSQF